MNEAPVEAVGPYRLESLLGKGGMGEVYRAFDERLGRSVAVKHMRPEVAGDPEVRARFQREAQAAAQLGHPAIAQVFDILEHAGDAWIVMELVDGPTLAELVCDGPLDVGLALSYVRQIVSALAEAHARGIIHRDLKTQNVMVLPSGHVKVLDFGLAKQRSPDDSLAEHSR
ncbi:MAG: serine/threonine-protein kinase, partial [Acidobacteriota bacterium]